METNKIMFEYLRSAKSDNLEDFLEYAHEIMFKSYVIKTFKETKKKYCISEKKNKDFCIYFDDMNNFEEFSLETDISLSIIDNIDNYKLYKFLKNLSVKQKNVLIEYYVNEKSEKDIGKMLGITKQAVNSMRKRALNNKG